MAGSDRLHRSGQVRRRDRRRGRSAGRYHRTATRSVCHEGRKSDQERHSMTARRQALVSLGCVLLAATAYGAEIRVMTSGALTAAYLQLIPEFERSTHNEIQTAYGASMGNAPDSIPSRLQRGEPADVVILAGTALDELIHQGLVVRGSRVDLARSS